MVIPVCERNSERCRASQSFHLVDSTPSPARRYLDRHCCKARLNTDVLPVLALTHVLQSMNVIIADVPNDPIRHPTLCQTYSRLACFRKHNGVPSTAIEK